MSITIKYRGLKDGPLLVVGKGRYPSRSKEEAVKDYTKPGDLYLSSSDSQLRSALREKEQERVLAEVERRVDGLIWKLDNLHTPTGDLVSREKTAVSPDPEALSVQADELARTSLTHTVEIVWPAQGKAVVSKPNNPIAPVGLDDGSHTFNFTIDGLERQVSVNVNNNSTEVDTQEDFLRRLARAIDGVDSRISAEVEHSFMDAYDPAPRSDLMNRVVRLKVESTEQGQGVDFYFSDAGGGQVIQEYGLGYSPPSRSARLKLGGELRDQATNSISLDNGHVTGQALGGTDGPVEVAVIKGASVIEGELKSLISQYNDLVGYMDTHADLLRPSLKDRVIRPLEERAGDMPGIGLRASLQGKLQMKNNFNEMINGAFGSVRQALLGAQGWAPALKEKLEQLKATGVNQFAVELDVEPVISARRRAWDLVDTISQDIISGYY